MNTHKVLGISTSRSITLYEMLITELAKARTFHDILGSLRQERLDGLLTYEECTYCAYALGVLSCKLPVDNLLEDRFDD